MGHGKETPRQKMIGMMYLVLTAMLALNVSAEVLDAFVLVENGLSQTTKNYRVKNEKLYNQFESQMLINEVKVKPWKEKADEVKRLANELIVFVQDLKHQVVLTSEGEGSEAIMEDKEINAEHIQNKSDTNVGSNILIGPERNGKATELKQMLIKYREFLISIVDAQKAPQLVESINSVLSTEDPPAKPDGTIHTWESYRFEHIPLVSVIPQLTKVQVDVLNTEAEVVTYLLQQVDAGDFKFNKLDAVVIPNSNYIIKDNEFNAQVFIAASDTTQRPKIYIGRYDSTRNDDGSWQYEMVGSYDTIPVENGRGIYRQRASQVGTSRWSGLIEMKDPSGGIFRKPFKYSYQVAPPNVVVSPSKMNVLYLGVDNPVEISISGIASHQISAQISRGRITRVGETFIATPSQGSNTCSISVFAEIDGVKKNMGSKEFRIKTVPAPLPSISGVSGKVVDKNVVANALGVVAQMPPDFDFDMKYTVTGFTISASIGGFTREETAKGQMFSDGQKRIMNGLKSGDNLTITNIKAVGNDGIVKDLNDLVYKIR